jgi:VanZ family protein
MLMAYHAGNNSSIKFILGSIILYGILTECIQLAFVPFRSFDVFDMVADMVGTFTGLFVFRLKR